MTVGSPTTDTLDRAKKNIGLRFVCLQDKNTRFPEVLIVTVQRSTYVSGIMTVHHFPA
jgi:hypothetical protein